MSIVNRIISSNTARLSKAASLALSLTFILASCTCIESNDIPLTSSTHQIIRDGVVINAATLPNGSSAGVSVEDYTLPQGDGSNEIHIGWSQTNAGAAQYASILFPASSFGDGVSNVKISAFHYNACKFTAYDSNNNLVATADHTAGQSTLQSVTLNSDNIRRIEVIGAEIGISKICYEK